MPVTVGIAAAHAAGQVVWWRGALALAVSVSVQVGTNYANDYSDGVRGTDAVRVGPTRLVASGLAPPAAVRRAAVASFGIAGACGLVLALATSLWVIPVGAACVAAGWFYTGGPRPYGYVGLGELFVFAFFGMVAVVGTAYVAEGRVFALAFAAAVPVGLAAVALLVVNNLRDIPTDAASGKKTLAVRLGAGRTRWFYASCLLAAVLSTALAAVRRPWAAIALVAAVVAIRPVRRVLSGAEGRDLVPVLGMTALFQLVLGTLLTVGLAV